MDLYLKQILEANKSGIEAIDESQLNYAKREKDYYIERDQIEKELKDAYETKKQHLITLYEAKSTEIQTEIDSKLQKQLENLEIEFKEKVYSQLDRIVEDIITYE